MNRPKSQPFYDLQDELRELHDEKGEAYEGSSETYANYRRVAKWKQAIISNSDQLPLIYTLMRNEEKMERAKNLLEGGEPGSESLEDTLKDLAIIPAIGLLLYREKPAPNIQYNCNCNGTLGGVGDSHSPSVCSGNQISLDSKNQ